MTYSLEQVSSFLFFMFKVFLFKITNCRNVKRIRHIMVQIYGTFTEVFTYLKYVIFQGKGFFLGGKRINSEDGKKEK